MSVIGTGAWGITLSGILASRQHRVSLWVRRRAEVPELVQTWGQSAPALNPWPRRMTFSDDLAAVVAGCDFLFIAVPSQTMRANAAAVAPHLQPGTVVLSATKGLEVGTAMRMTEVLIEELGRQVQARLAVLSGPNLSAEIRAGLPAASVVAAYVAQTAGAVQDVLMTPDFRIYTHTDVVGVELAGALKNIIALAAGISDGLGFGDNTKASLITRGLAEITRLGVAVGADPLTFSGLAGLGDLVATCSSSHSRNHYVGFEIARGRRLGEVQKGMKMVAEGVQTAVAARQLAGRYQVEMPITEQVYQVLFESKPPRQAVIELMTRDAKEELQGLRHPTNA